MNIALQVFLIVSILLFMSLLLYYLSKKELNLKYTLTWLLSTLVLLVIAIFPQIVDVVGRFVGVANPVNTIFLFSGMFSFLILLTLTFIVSRLNNRVYRLTQTIALLEKRLRDSEALHEKSKFTEGD